MNNRWRSPQHGVCLRRTCRSVVQLPTPPGFSSRGAALAAGPPVPVPPPPSLAWPLPSPLTPTTPTPHTHVHMDPAPAGEKGTQGSYEYLVYSNVLVGVAAQYGLRPVLDYGDPALAELFEVVSPPVAGCLPAVSMFNPRMACCVPCKVFNTAVGALWRPQLPGLLSRHLNLLGLMLLL